MNGTLWVFTGNTLTDATPPQPQPLDATNLAPGALVPRAVEGATTKSINFDAYGPDACTGVQ